MTAIERVVQKTLATKLNPDVFIIDEIGKMECCSPLFVQRTSVLLNSGIPVVATIAQRGGGFISEVKERAGIELWEETKKNRDILAGKVVEWIMDRL